MRYGRLGDSGLAVSVVGLGCNNFGRRIDRDASHAVVDTAITAGVTLFDTADSYGTPPGTSEQFLGEALKGRRDDVIVATKFGHDLRGANGPDWGARGSRRYVLRAVEASLRRLDTDWIDLYQLHYPDEETPVEETLATLTDLVKEGKVRYIGCSNVAGWQVADAAWTASSAGLAGFISVQNEYSLLDRSIEAEVVPACERFGLGVLPYFPLAQGLLTGKFRRGEPAAPGTRLATRPEVLDSADWDVVEALAAFVEERDVGLLDVAIGWLAAQPAVASVIAGATRPEQVPANVAAVEWIPSVEDLAALDAITASRR
ncbi:MAG TPA: aldo/keto reductase [Actinomycetes bacterium]|jgi:aryl-alcohol dehydrogenase-like predicted oxidoreductase